MIAALAVLEAFAKINPITNFIDAIRVLTLDVQPGTASVSTEHPILMSLGWLIVMVAIFAPLAVRSYSRKT